MGGFLEASECREEVEEFAEVLGAGFVADGQASVAGEPHDGAFDLPPVPDQPVDPLQSAAGRPTSGLHRRDRADHRLQQGAVVGVRSGNIDDQRDAVGLGQDVDLRPLLAAIDRTMMPLFTRTLAASRFAAIQSSSPALPSRSSTLRCSLSNTPAAAQTVNLRCGVGTVTPNEGGRCRHAPHWSARTRSR